MTKIGDAYPLGRLDDLHHGELALLAREYLLAGHLIDRAGMPHVISSMGREAMTEVAIEEWSGASPLYTRRMQRALRFADADVATIFKGMQLDIGAPPEFLDFRFEIIDEHHGRFHLDHCGALADVEPLGDAYVTAMCHHIEDPTFDATAAATNPRARMRPIHRPPRRPADRSPVCEWIVDIDNSRDPIPFPAVADALSATAAAGIELGHSLVGSSDGLESGLLADYSGAFDPDLLPEHFDVGALRVICAETMLQGHLLALSFGQAVQRRTDAAVAAEMLGHQMVGVAGVVAGRLANTLRAGRGLDGIATVLQRHPLFGPRPYVDASLRRVGGALRIDLAPCPATGEAVPSWAGILAADGADAVAAIAENVDPLARVRRVDAGEATAAWEITMGDSAVPERDDVTLTRFSTGAEFEFRRLGRR